MREALAIALAMVLGIYSVSATQGYDIQASIDETLSPVLLRITLAHRDNHSSIDRSQLHSTLAEKRVNASNYYTKKAIDQLLSKIQTIIDTSDSHNTDAPAPAVAKALAETYTY